MIDRLISFSARNGFAVLLLVVGIVGGGIWAVSRTPIDAIPDLSDVQVIVQTNYGEQAPRIVEDQVTYPIATTSLGEPRVKTVRGFTMFGMSFVYVIFEDGTDTYWARSRTLEYLSKLQGKLPPGVAPQLGPDATGVGWIYQYALVDTTGKYSLAELRSVQDWYLRYQLTAVPGVSEVASVGGFEKTYEATLLLGVVTHSQDMTGDVIERRRVAVDEEAVRAASRALTGDLDQVPPMVSALRVGGERLHALARRGIEVARAPRRVHVSSWEWLDIAIPEATFRVRCSSGTYVRTLAHDLGMALGCGAALASLRRLRSEPFGIERAVSPDDLGAHSREEILERAGVPLDRALAVLPALVLDDAATASVGAGGRPAVEPGDAPIAAGPRSIVFRDTAGRALALGELQSDPGIPGRVLACPRVVFPWTARGGA